ncbi:MAG: substrate-binding domain-containing protein, partial [Phycisphaeraceae bacterium]
YPGNPASEAREQGFFRTVAGLPGAARHTFESTGAPGAEDAKNIKPFDEQLGAWLKQLTPPIGLMAWNDAAAAVLVQTCARIGLSVPEQVAVIGVNDDEAWCGFCVPPLTSVRPPLKRIGYEGAQLLAQLMEGEPVPSEPLLLPPEGVHVRRSTDVLAVDDPVVARALRYIREHVSERINVADVVRHVRVSRRLLEDRFREHLGRSPLKEIHREQLRIADHLLRTTNLPPKVIAMRAGYRDVNHLTRVFSKERGLPPATYRRECRME